MRYGPACTSRRCNRARSSRCLVAPLLFASGIAIATSAQAAHGDVCDTLRQKTQRFSDAGQSGDGKTAGAMVDKDVIFFNEGGDSASSADLSAGGPPPPAGVTTQMTVSDWNCRLHGTVAVTSFIDEQKQDFHGQSLAARYRSVETWLQEAGDWRMIGSETIALVDDPVAVTLPPATLDDYVGTYSAAPGVAFVFARHGSAITASLNGGPETPQHAEMRDVLFTPGRARIRKIFQRDAAGRVTGMIYRREGHDILYKKV